MWNCWFIQTQLSHATYFGDINSFLEKFVFYVFYGKFLLNRENIMPFNLITFPTYLIYCFIIYDVLTIRKSDINQAISFVVFDCRKNWQMTLIFLSNFFSEWTVLFKDTVLASVTNYYRSGMFKFNFYLLSSSISMPRKISCDLRIKDKLDSGINEGFLVILWNFIC